MNATTKSKKIAKALSFLTVALLLCGFAVSAATVPTTAYAATKASYQLPSTGLPTGVPDVVDGQEGYLYTYTLPSGFYKNYGYGLNSGTASSTDDNAEAPVIDIQNDYFRVGTGENSFAAGYTATIYGFMTIPKELQGLTNASVKARLTFDYEAKSKTSDDGVENQAGMTVTMGSYALAPDDTVAATAKGANSSRIEGSKNGSTATGTEATSWGNLNLTQNYLVINMKVDGFTNVEETGGFLGIGTDKWCETSFKVKNVVVELFVVNDGNAPTITPWMPTYSVNNTSGEYVRADDKLNFVKYVDGMEGTRYDVNYDTLMPLTEEYFNSSNSFGGEAYKYGAYYHGNQGKVLCHEYTSSALDDGTNNMFLSQQRVTSKTVSFIVYDYFSGIKELSVTVNGVAQVIYADQENSFSWGDVEATSFAYLDSSKSSEVYRGIAVKMTINQSGNYQVTVTDQGELQSFVYVNVGGMDMDAPEIPNIVIENAKTDSDNVYVANTSDRIRLLWQIDEEEEAGQTDVTYIYKIEKEQNGSWVEFAAETTIDTSKYISVKGSYSRYFTLNGITNGKYRITVRCYDAAGNVGVYQDAFSSSETRSIEFVADNVVPQIEVSMTSGTQNYLGEWVKGKAVSAKYNVLSDVISGVTYYYRIGNGAEQTVKTGSKNFSENMDETVYFWAVSGAGLTSNIVSATIKIDSTAPEFPPIANGLLAYSSEIKFADGTGSTKADALPYVYPWGVVPYMAIEGADTNSPYVYDYKYCYKVYAYEGGSLNGGGKEYSVSYSNGTTFVLDLFDDGTSGERVYGKKCVEMWVVDQAGNTSTTVSYIIDVKQPEISVSFEKTDVNPDKFYDGTTKVADGYVNAVLTIDGQTVSEYMQNAQAGFAEDESFAVNFDYRFESSSAAEGIQIVVYNVSTVAGCNKYIQYYKIVDADNADVNESTEFLPADFTGNIQKVRLTVADFEFVEREYDGTTVALVASKGVLTSLDSVLDQSVVDMLTYTYDAESAVYADKNVGEKSVLLTGLVLSVVDPTNAALLDNFTFIDSLEVVGNITPKKLTLQTFTASGEKIYDGETTVDAANVQVVLADGVLAGEDVDVDYTARLKNANVQYNELGAVVPNVLTVAIKGLKGADAANYSITAEEKTFDFTVNPKEVSVKSITIQGNKVYDGTDKLVDENGNKLSFKTDIDGLVEGDKAFITVTYDTSSSRFASANVGEWDIQIDGIKLVSNFTGYSVGNYVLKAGDESFVTKAKITQRELKVSVSASARAYNGTTMAENPVVSVSNVVSGETVFVGKPATSFTNYVSARTPDGAIVDLYRIGYSLDTAGVSSYVEFVVGGYKHIDEVSSEAAAAMVHYTVTFTPDEAGDYLLDETIGHYRLIQPGETATERYKVNNADDNNNLLAGEDVYVVWHMIYNADGTENHNYCFSFDGNSRISQYAPAAITKASAVAEIVGFYTLDESGNPYLAADGITKDYIQKLYYGAKTAILASGKEVKVNGFRFDVRYFCDTLTIDGNLQPTVEITEENYPSLNGAKVEQPKYEKLSVGTGTVGLKGAYVNNFDFVEYRGLDFEIVPAPVTLTIGDATVKYKERIKLADITKKISGLQNNEKLSTLLGNNPVAALVVDGQIKEGVNNVIEAEIKPGTYDIVFRLVAEDGYSFENYVVTATEGYTVKAVAGGFEVTKKNAFTVTKNIYTNYQFATKGSYDYNGTASALPLNISSLPDNVTTDDLKIYVYTGSEDNWTLADAYSYKYAYDMTTGTWSAKSTTGYDGKGVKDAGTYKIVYELTDMSNYEDISLTGYLTINKKKVSVTMSVSVYEKVYDGTSVNLWNFKTDDGSDLSISVNGVSMGESNTQYSTDAKFRTLISQSQVKNAGTYYCRLYYAGDSNVQYAYSDTLVITIRPKAVTIIVGETKFDYSDYYDEDGEPVAIYDEDDEYVGDAEFVGLTYKFAEGTDEKLAATLASKIKIQYLVDTAKGNDWKEIDWTTDANKELIKNSQQANAKSSWSYRITCTDGNYQLLASGGLLGYMEIGSRIVYSAEEDGTLQDAYYFLARLYYSQSVSKDSKFDFAEVERLTPDSWLIDPDYYDFDNPEDYATYEEELENYNSDFNVWYNKIQKPLDNNKQELGLSGGTITTMSVFTLRFFNAGYEIKSLGESLPVTVSYDAFGWTDKNATVSAQNYTYTADGQIVKGGNVSANIGKLKLVRIGNGRVTEIPFEVAFDETSEYYVFNFSTDTVGEDCYYAFIYGQSASMTDSTRYIIVAIACAVGGFAIILAVVLIVSAKARAAAVEVLGRPIDARSQKKADRAKKKEERQAEKEAEKEDSDEDDSDEDDSDDEKEAEKPAETKKEEPAEQTKPTAPPSGRTPPTGRPTAETEAKAEAKPATAATNVTATTATTPAARPATAPAARPATTPAARPATTPAARPATTPAARPATAPAARPATTPATRPATTPAARPATTPTARPATTPAARPATTPAARPATTPTARPATPPTANPTTSPKPEDKK